MLILHADWVRRLVIQGLVPHMLAGRVAVLASSHDGPVVTTVGTDVNRCMGQVHWLC